MNDAHQVLAYADDVSLIGTIEWNADLLLNACKDIGLAGKVGKVGKTKYMKVGCHQDTMANKHITVGGNSYESVKKLFRLFIKKWKFYSQGNKMGRACRQNGRK